MNDRKKIISAITNKYKGYKLTNPTIQASFICDANIKLILIMVDGEFMWKYDPKQNPDVIFTYKDGDVTIHLCERKPEKNVIMKDKRQPPQLVKPPSQGIERDFGPITRAINSKLTKIGEETTEEIKRSFNILIRCFETQPQIHYGKYDSVTDLNMCSYSSDLVDKLKEFDPYFQCKTCETVFNPHMKGKYACCEYHCILVESNRSVNILSKTSFPQHDTFILEIGPEEKEQVKKINDTRMDQLVDNFYHNFSIED